MKKRILLVSDMHYTTQETTQELKIKYPNSNASVAAGTILGVTQKEKIQKLLNDILKEHQTAPLDSVLVLGDLSIDDYDFRKLPECYCRKFKEDCMDKLPCPAYALPGNHDSITNDMWKEIFGVNREYSVKIGNNVFIMADTFKGVPATGASGAGYTGINKDFLEKELSKYTDENIFVCAHYISKNEPELGKIPNLVCLFGGHTHSSRTLKFGEYPLFDIGGYGYNGIVGKDGKYTFNVFFEECAWGYNILEIYENRVEVVHKQVAMTYKAENGVFNITENESPKSVINLNNK